MAQVPREQDTNGPGPAGKSALPAAGGPPSRSRTHAPIRPDRLPGVPDARGDPEKSTPGGTVRNRPAGGLLSIEDTGYSKSLAFFGGAFFIVIVTGPLAGTTNR
jgi:hypothetical protein